MKFGEPTTYPTLPLYRVTPVSVTSSVILLGVTLLQVVPPLVVRMMPESLTAMTVLVLNAFTLRKVVVEGSGEVCWVHVNVEPSLLIPV